MFQAVYELSSKGSHVQDKKQNVLNIQHFVLLYVVTGGGKELSSEEFDNLYFWP
jgi:hypothetical protein